jgi:hypothetical protein
MKATQHVPNYIDCDPYTAEVATLEELLALEWVSFWKESPNDGEEFHKYSQSKVDDGCYLMAEYNKGKSWWVVGYIDEQLDLPEWKG